MRRDGVARVKRLLKRHAALPLLAIGLAILIILYFQISGARNNGKLELVDLYGDRSALRDVVLSGYVQDSYHRMSFELTEDKIDKETVVFGKPSQPIANYSPGMPLPSGDRAYQIFPGFYAGIGFEIQAWRMQEGYRMNVEGTALVETALQYKGTADGYSFSNHQEKGLAFVGERIFYVPPTTRYYTGKSGIYEVLRFGDRNSMQKPEEDETRVLVELNMEGNRQEAWQGLEILGLEAVGDKLALIALEDGEIVVSGYDSETGDSLGRVRLAEYVYMLGQGTEPPKADDYYEDYEAYVDEDLGVLNLKFYNTGSPENETRHMVASISMKDEVKLINKQELSYKGRDRSPSGASNNWFSFRNGRLYVMKVSSVEPEMYTLFESLYDQQVMIEVYENGEKLYAGELRTDVNDDVIEDRYLASTHFQQERSEYREIGGLRIGNAK
ncbi:hypothetical protein B1748_32245 [Paenibacillus sp. MY03]|uniref:hypothetical protein n=1 Tax=Paenibacillus sp. MY03 TaxID=302980 RepID=UPI000B3C76F5|nr:hypothetical protein [Paenibacillus sp. MY03]OUS69094.1 hypothetical protein B1748_32245 [Paenibacillus sp. MY03]